MELGSPIDLESVCDQEGWFDATRLPTTRRGRARVFCPKMRYHMRSGHDDWHHQKVEIDLDFTPVHLGGERPWFMCPSCGRRCLSLYWLGQFECRKCHDLVFQTASVDSLHRLEVRLDRVRSKLDGTVFAGAFIPRRPTGMHHRTYIRLDAEYREIEREMWRKAVARFTRPRA